MKVRVGEKVYEINSLEDMEMDHLIRMQEEAGIGDQTFQRRGNAEMARAQAYAAEVKIAEKEGRAAPDQPDGDMLFMALIVWLARLAAGEDISWADARKVKMRDLEVIPDEVKKADGEVESDPTQPAVKPSASSGRSKRTLAAAS